MQCFDLHQNDDKDFGFPTHFGDSGIDFFDEYYLNESTHVVNDVEPADSFEYFNFGFEEDTTDTTTSSDTRSADSVVNLKHPQPRSTINASVLETERIPALRTQRVHPRYNRSSPGISGAELLSLEGRSQSRAGTHVQEKPVSASTSYSAAPTLRRKARFHAETKDIQRDPPHRVVKTSSNGLPSPALQGPPKMAPYQDFQQDFDEKFGKMDIHPMSPPNAVDQSELRYDSTRQPRTHRKTVSDFPTPSHGNYQISPMTDRTHHTSFPMSPNPIDQQSIEAGGMPNGLPTTSDLRAQFANPALRQSRHNQHPASWDGGLTTTNPHRYDSTIHPNSINPSWIHGLPEKPDAYFDVSSPPLPSPTPDYLSADFPMPFDTFGQFTQSGASNGYGMDPSQHYPSPNTEANNTNLYTTTTANNNNNNNINNHLLTSNPRPHTPTSRKNSTSPPPLPTNPQSHLPNIPANPPTPTTSNNKVRRPRPHTLHLSSPSKPHNHKSSTSLSLKSPRSAKDLRSPKSASSLSHHNAQKLKSPRSAGTLKSPRSTLKSPSKSSRGSIAGSVADFGFVNFTPDDKGKILTGVAPSGSSKTKARREMEAIEKKRRFSMAAYKAVEKAGGDVGILRGEGVL